MMYSIFILVSVFVSQFSYSIVNAECCEPKILKNCANGLKFGCLDCKKGTPFCGVGGCNVFGCNCDGGCRKPQVLDAVVKLSQSSNTSVTSEEEGFKAMDTNGDGLLTFDEVRAKLDYFTVEDFQSVSKNGTITFAQFLNA